MKPNFRIRLVIKREDIPSEELAKQLLDSKGWPDVAWTDIWRGRIITCLTPLSNIDEHALYELLSCILFGYLDPKLINVASLRINDEHVVLLLDAATENEEELMDSLSERIWKEIGGYTDIDFSVKHIDSAPCEDYHYGHKQYDDFFSKTLEPEIVAQ